MSKAEYFQDRREYIEGLWTGLCGFDDLEAIQYAWSIKNEGEYIRIKDSISNDIYLHVEGLTKAEIFREIAKVILQGDFEECVPDRLITDDEQKRKIVSLFRKGVQSEN